VNVAAGLIREVAEVGEHLGFTVDPEHWAVDYKEVGVYRPRIDCVWADSLSSYGYDASPLNAVLPAPLAEPYGLFGFEVEATDPTTKSQFANLTSLALAAAPYAVLVVNIISAADAYRRANRAVRTFNARFGLREAAAIDIDSIRRLPSLPSKSLLQPAAAGTSERKGGGVGGEGALGKKVREHIVSTGRRAGFVVTQDAADQRLASRFQRSKRLGAGAVEVASAPGEVRQANTPAQLWTESKPDVVWSVRTGAGLREIVDRIAHDNLGLRSIHQTFGPVPDLLPVATFEIEANADSKHARGGILSLAARPGVGIFVALSGDPLPTLRAYRPILGAGNVIGMSANDLLNLW
jgi:hypothetical protein